MRRGTTHRSRYLVLDLQLDLPYNTLIDHTITHPTCPSYVGAELRHQEMHGDLLGVDTPSMRKAIQAKTSRYAGLLSVQKAVSERPPCFWVPVVTTLGHLSTHMCSLRDALCGQKRLLLTREGQDRPDGISINSLVAQFRNRLNADLCCGGYR